MLTVELVFDEVLQRGRTKIHWCQYLNCNTVCRFFQSYVGLFTDAGYIYRSCFVGLFKTLPLHVDHCSYVSLIDYSLKNNTLWSRNGLIVLLESKLDGVGGNKKDWLLHMFDFPTQGTFAQTLYSALYCKQLYALCLGKCSKIFSRTG